MIFKISASPYMERLLQEAGKLTHTTPKGAFDRLLVQIELCARNGKLDLGLEWTEAMHKVGGAHALQAPVEAQESIAFDVSLLETSAKCKGGYAGVYLVNGSKFRAIVPNPKGGTCFLSTRPQALDAAIDRYRWHLAHGIPYGNIGRAVDDYRKRHPEWSIEKCLEQAYFFAKDTQPDHMKWPFTVDQIVETLAQFRKAHGLVSKEIEVEYEATPIIDTGYDGSDPDDDDAS